MRLTDRRVCGIQFERWTVMNVFPPLTGHLMYYASPPTHPHLIREADEARGRRGGGGCPCPTHPDIGYINDCTFHAFHFPAHRSREELIGPSLIGGDSRAHPSIFSCALHVWQSIWTQWLKRASPVSPQSNCQRHKNVGSCPEVGWEGGAIGCPAATVILRLRASRRRPPYTRKRCASFSRLADGEERGAVLLQPVNAKPHGFGAIALIRWYGTAGLLCCRYHVASCI